jgi:hypothetical protein
MQKRGRAASLSTLVGKCSQSTALVVAPASAAPTAEANRRRSSGRGA